MKIIRNFLLKYLVICVAILAIVTAFTVVFFNNSKGILEESVQSRLFSNLEAASLYISSSEHEQIRRNYMDEEINENNYETSRLYADETYKTIIGNLRELCDSIGATYIYTININSDGEFYFILDTDRNNYTYVGELYELDDNDTQFFNQALSQPKSFFVQEVSDDFGRYMTGCKAILNSFGKIEAILAIDIPIDYLHKHRTTFAVTLAVLDGVLLIAFGLTGFYLYKLLQRNAEMQEKIEHMAYYDSLTTLPNRVSLIDKLKSLTIALDSNPNYSLSLLFIDIDNFKKVNDSEGHVVGDILLQDIAKFLKANSNLKPLASKNKEFVARLGGDEFVMIYPIKKEDELEKFAQHLLDGFTKLKSSNEVMQKYNVSLSIGCSIYPKDANSVSSLLKTADTAMYHAKRNGKGNYAIYTPNMMMERKDEEYR